MRNAADKVMKMEMVLFVRAGSLALQRKAKEATPNISWLTIRTTFGKMQYNEIAKVVLKVEYLQLI